MSFAPIQFDGRCSLGARLGYMTKKKTAKSGARLRISICPEYVSKMVWKEGACVRLDVDAKAGQARLLTVGSVGKAARRLVLRTTTGRGGLEFPFSGTALQLFAPTNEMAELKVIEIKATDGLVFELPLPVATARGGES